MSGEPNQKNKNCQKKTHDLSNSLTTFTFRSRNRLACFNIKKQFLFIAIVSSSYGERPGQRPLSTSYLHERETPTVISGDRNSDANTNQTKQSQTTNSYDNDHTNRNNNDDSTDKSTADALKNPIDETNTVTSSTDNTTE